MNYIAMSYICEYCLKDNKNPNCRKCKKLNKKEDKNE